MSSIAFDVGLVGAVDEVVEELRRVRPAGDFGRVQAAVDVHERLAFVRELLRLGVGQTLRVGEPPRDLAIAIDLRRGCPATTPARSTWPPLLVLPASTSFTYLVAAASFLK